MRLKNILLTVLLFIVSQTTLMAKDANILSYVDRGIKYHPKYVKTGLTKITKASWYGKPFHGRQTANGERYNMYKMTAAHRTYAMNTVLKVTNLSNKKSVKVRINDRGPFYSSRKIDLSYGAARRIGMVQKGVGKVKIEVLSSGYRKKEKKKIVRKTVNREKKINRPLQIQIASFFNKEYANNFAKKNKLKNIIIVKKYIKSKKKIAYRVVIKCTPWEAKHLLKSKKFDGAYLLS
jgi:rare lipoprotein A